MQLFYTPYIDQQQAVFSLDETESKHAVRVLRLTVGDEVNLIDGRGGFYKAVITDDHPKHTALKILEAIQGFQQRNYYLHVAIAPTKNIERIEWFLEKATEIGIDEITLTICDRSERREVNTDRLTRIIVSAMKQSLKAYLPKLNEPVKFDHLVSKSFAGKRYIAHCAEGEKQYVAHSLLQGENSLVLIGPEGDFSEREISTAVAYGFQQVTLGHSRLRTETAALASCMEVAFVNR